MSVIKYRPDIDGLRAVAVGCVVCFHAFPNLLKGGFVGVDVFFVVSGFLISNIIFQGLEDERFSYVDFYSRRIRRIFPALAAVCAATLLLGWFVLLPDEFQLLGKHVAGGAGFVSNFVLWSESGYFDAAAESKPLLHLWSLGIEEQFYLAWPLVLGLIWKRKRGFFAVTLLVAAISFAINIATIHNSPVAAFYSPLSRFWELMIGGALAYIVMHRPAMLRGYSDARSIGGILLIAFTGVQLNAESAFPGFWALLPTCGAFLAISAGPNAWLNRYVLASKPMVWVGLISYPLYLWHWPVLVFYRIASGRLLTPIDRIGAVVVACGLALLTYRLLERPLRRAPGRTAPMLAGAMACIGALGLSGYFGVVHSRLHTEGIAKILAATYDWKYPPVAAQSGGLGALRYFVEESDMHSYTLFLGDSNMEQYAPRIDRAIKDHVSTNRGAILVGNQSGCLLLNEIMTDGDRCPEAVAQLKSLIARDSTRAVTIAVAWMAYKDALERTEARIRLAQFLGSITRTKRVYLILNMPEGEELSPRSMFEGSRLTTLVAKPVASVAFDLDRFEEKYRYINGILASVAKETGATIVDPIPHLCPQRRCPVFDDEGNPLYLDKAHFTRNYSLRAASYIDETLE